MDNVSGVPEAAKSRRQDILIVAGAFIFLCICVAAVAGGGVYLQSNQNARATVQRQTEAVRATIFMQTRSAHDSQVTATHNALATERADFEFSDPFDDNANKWWIGYQDNEYWSGSTGIGNGLYFWTVEHAKQGFVSWRSPGGQSQFSDFDAYVDVRRFEGVASHMSYGLQFREATVNKDEFYYAFTISDNGYYRFQYHDGDTNKWSDIVGWNRSNAILADEWNSLGVSARGIHFVLTINDQVVGEFIDGYLGRGSIALFICMDSGETGTIWFDNLDIQGR